MENVVLIIIAVNFIINNFSDPIFPANDTERHQLTVDILIYARYTISIN